MEELRSCCYSIFVKKDMSIFILPPKLKPTTTSQKGVYLYICIIIYVFIYIQDVPIPIVLLSRSKAEECECQECTGSSGMDIIAWPVINLVFCPFHELTCYSSIYFFHKL